MVAVGHGRRLLRNDADEATRALDHHDHFFFSDHRGRCAIDERSSPHLCTCSAPCAHDCARACTGASSPAAGTGASHRQGHVDLLA